MKLRVKAIEVLTTDAGKVVLEGRVNGVSFATQLYLYLPIVELANYPLGSEHIVGVLRAEEVSNAAA